MNLAVRTQTKAKHIRQEGKMRTCKERDHVRERQIPGSKPGFGQGGNSKAKTKSVHRDIDGLEEDSASSPWTEESMTAKEVRIREVLGHKDREPFAHRRCGKVDEDESEEEPACGRRIDLRDIHGKEGERKTNDDVRNRMKRRVEERSWRKTEEYKATPPGSKQSPDALEGTQRGCLKEGPFWLQANFSYGHLEAIELAGKAIESLDFDQHVVRQSREASSMPACEICRQRLRPNPPSLEVYLFASRTEVSGAGEVRS